MNIFRRKSISSLQAEAANSHGLRRELTALNLVMLGVGCAIGTGIFVLTGTVAALNAGPAIILSFVFAGIASAFAAFCYSEFASMVPISGSAYTYGYATLGEVFGWIIGWNLVLEYAVGAITVAVGWSGYFVSLLADFGIHFPPALSAARGTEMIEIPAALAHTLNIRPGWTAVSESKDWLAESVARLFSIFHIPSGWMAESSGDLLHKIQALGVNTASMSHVTAVFNLPAVLIVLAVSLLLVIGIRESANANNLIVFIKLGVIVLFIAAVAPLIDPHNWHPFIPAHIAGTPTTQFGWGGVFSGAAIVFFAYVGFDAVSTAAQETKNPQRDMPIGLIGSLIVCTVLYILVAAIATGAVSYTQLNVPDPIAYVADVTRGGWMATLIKIGAVAGLSSVILVLMLGQSRIFWSMAKDGLLPPVIGKLHPKFRTPWITTILLGVIVAFFAALFSVRDAANLCSIGTLLAFAIVCGSVLVLRVREPDLPRKFRVPWVWVIAPLGVLSAIALMCNLPMLTWLRLIIWSAIGFVIYFGYGVWRSKLANGGNGTTGSPDDEEKIEPLD